MQVHGPEQLRCQVMLLKQVPKLARRALIRHRLTPQIDPHERVHRRQVVRRPLQRRIGQRISLLQELDVQHPCQAHPAPTAFRPSSEDLEQTLHRYVTLYNYHLPHKTLNAHTLVQALLQKGDASKSELFLQKPSNRPTSARCGSKKIGGPIVSAKPAHQPDYGIRIPRTRSVRHPDTEKGKLRRGLQKREQSNVRFHGPSSIGHCSTFGSVGQRGRSK